MELEQRIAVSKTNPYELNNLISEYKPFIAKVVCKAIGRFVEYGKDDELSIGLMAFEEAVRSFNNTKGTFISFAENVIKRRLIDYYRKESRHESQVPFSAFYNEQEEEEIDFTESLAVQNYTDKEICEMRKIEIIEIQKELQKWGISFFDLPENSPKHQETKEIYWQIINAVLNNQSIKEKLLTKRYFPVAEIENLTKIHRKKVERSRIYVIAMIVILNGDYKYIQSYIDKR